MYNVTYTRHETIEAPSTGYIDHIHICTLNGTCIDTHNTLVVFSTRYVNRLHIHNSNSTCIDIHNTLTTHGGDQTLKIFGSPDLTAFQLDLESYGDSD